MVRLSLYLCITEHQTCMKGLIPRRCCLVGNIRNSQSSSKMAPFRNNRKASPLDELVMNAVRRGKAHTLSPLQAQCIHTLKLMRSAAPIRKSLLEYLKVPSSLRYNGPAIPDAHRQLSRPVWKSTGLSGLNLTVHMRK